METLQIYTHELTNRNQYMFRLYFGELLGIPYAVTTDQEVFLRSTGPRLSYTHQPLADELFFHSRSLLFETGIREQNIVVVDWNDHRVFFASGKKSELPFDVFAAGFYLISRYEEYLPHIRDGHDRFDAHQSLAWQHGFLLQPVVNQWAAVLAGCLLARFPKLNIPSRSYLYLPTIDIDNAWAYREKGMMRTTGGIFRDLLRLDMPELKTRLRVLLNLQQDPYDTYAFQLAMQRRYGFRPVYFFLVGDYGLNDKNIPVQNRHFRELIRHLADYADVGVHPSYGSNAKPEKLKVEIGRLRSILHMEIVRSRQHFLKLKFPDTYRNLIDRDVTDDYSMGYANEIGFRASICTPYNFYDLDYESETPLRVHPFAVMDATLNLYMKLTPEQAIEQVRKLIAVVRSVNGVFITLWHNETLSDEKQWKGWRSVYETIVADACDDRQRSHSNQSRT